VRPSPPRAAGGAGRGYSELRHFLYGFWVGHNVSAPVIGIDDVWIGLIGTTVAEELPYAPAVPHISGYGLPSILKSRITASTS